LGLFGLVALLLVLHLVGDRLTPFSDQARTHAYVVAIAPEVTGLVEKVYVKNNQMVGPGQPLFTLNKTTYEIAAQKAQADMSATRRDLKAADAGIDVAVANVAAAQANRTRVTIDAARNEKILAEDPGAISLRRVELARAQKAQGESQEAAAVAQVAQARQARGDIGPLNDRLIAAQTALDKAQLDLKRTTIFAPGNGVVTDLRTDTGQFAGPGNPIMTFIAIHDGWVTADMTENNMGRMAVGDPAEVVFDVAPGKIVKGRVRSMGYGVSGGEKPTPGALPDVQNSRDWLRPAQRFPVIIEFNRDDLAKLNGLREGGQAEVIVYTGDHPFMNSLAWLYIRIMGLLAYVF
jgi:multidrug resistance efflux pump